MNSTEPTRNETDISKFWDGNGRLRLENWYWGYHKHLDFLSKLFFDEGYSDHIYICSLICDRLLQLRISQSF